MRLVRRKLCLAWCIVASFAISAYAQDGSDPKVVQAARKEGEIVWYTTMSSDQSNAFMARFQQKYSFLKPSVIRLGGSALLNRVLTEAKAGKNFFDVVHGTGEIVLPLMDMGLLTPYMSPERKMIADDLKDKKGFWTSVYVNSVVLGYNTNLLKGQVVPRSLQRSFAAEMERAKNFRRRYVRDLSARADCRLGQRQGARLSEKIGGTRTGGHARQHRARSVGRRRRISPGDRLCQHHSISRRERARRSIGCLLSPR